MQDVAQEHDVVTVTKVIRERVPNVVGHDIVKALRLCQLA
jgi:hypothetical protein